MNGGADAHEIVPGIWLGNQAAALDTKWLKSANITVVFNCTKNVPFSPIIRKQYRLPVDDNLREEEIRNMTLWSHEVIYNLILEHKKGNHILVHCAAGMQRSAAVVAMYLISTKGLVWQDAISYIQRIRTIAFRPGANFKNSIIEFNRSYNEDIRPRLS